MPFPDGAETLDRIPIAAQFFDSGGLWFNAMHPDGAVGDGSVDDTAGILARDADAAAAGGVLVFPPGTYRITGSSPNAAQASWLGMPGAVIDVSECDLAQQEGAFEWSDLTGLWIAGLTWQDTATTLKIPVVLLGCSDVMITRNRFVQQNGTGNIACIDILGGTTGSESSNVVVSHNVFFPTNIAVLVQANISGWTLNRVVISDNVVDGSNANFAADGVLKIDGASGTVRDFVIADNVLVGDRTVSTPWDDGIVVEEGVDGGVVSGNTVRGVDSIGVFVHEGQSNAAVDGVTIANNVIEDCGTHGIQIDPGTVGFSNISVVGNIIRNVDSGGIRNALAGVDGMLVAFNIIDEFAQVTSTQGILIASAGATIVGNVVRRTGSTASSQSLRLSDAGATNCVIVGNQFEATDSDGDFISSAASVLTQQIVGNTGMVTRNEGTATVADGNTTVSVTHGLGSQGGGLNTTPHDVQVTPTNDLGNAALFWVTAIGATTFTINVDADPGASTATFQWSASVSGA